MGILSFLKRSRKEEVSEERDDLSESQDYSKAEVRRNFVSGNCEIMSEADKNNAEVKKEYEVVTAYLSDIQKIDRLNENVKGKIDDIAKHIISLEQEKNKFQKATPRISGVHKLCFQQNEEGMPDEIKNLEKEEKHLEMIQKDLELIGKERAELEEAREEAQNKGNSLKKTGIAICVLLMVFLTLLFTANEWLELDMAMEIPVMVIISIGVIGSGMVALFTKTTVADIKNVESRLNKAILIQNKIKIKYVNSRNMLDYAYEKYHVSNSRELANYWQEYIRAVEEERRFNQAADLLDYYNGELIKMLEKCDVSDAEVWIYQPEALISREKFEEVRNRLMGRRQKLRQRIEYNNKLKARSAKALLEYIRKYPAYSAEAEEYVKKSKCMVFDT